MHLVPSYGQLVLRGPLEAAGRDGNEISLLKKLKQLSFQTIKRPIPSPQSQQFLFTKPFATLRRQFIIVVLMNTGTS